MYVIYVHTNIISKRSYVGCAGHRLRDRFSLTLTEMTINEAFIECIRLVNRRWQEHLNVAYETDARWALSHAIRKYGKNSWEHSVVSVCETHEEAKKQEKFWITQYPNSYNETVGGEGGRLTGEAAVRHKQSMSDPKTIARMSASQRMINKDPNVIANKKHAQKIAQNRIEVKQRNSKIKAAWARPEVKQKAKESNQKPETIAKRSASQKVAQNKKDVTERKRQTMKQTAQTPEWKVSHAARMKEVNNRPNVKEKFRKRKSKPVQQLDINDVVLQTYTSTVHAAQQTGIAQSGISRAASGKATQAGGFKWKFC